READPRSARHRDDGRRDRLCLRETGERRGRTVRAPPPLAGDQYRARLSRGPRRLDLRFHAGASDGRRPSAPRDGRPHRGRHRPALRGGRDAPGARNSDHRYARVAEGRGRAFPRVVARCAGGWVVTNEVTAVTQANEFDSALTTAGDFQIQGARLFRDVMNRDGWSAQDSADMRQVASSYGKAADVLAASSAPAEYAWYRDGLVRNYREAVDIAMLFSNLTSASS